MNELFAGQSIEDAFVLAHCVAAERDDPPCALEMYAARRRERTAAVQAASREFSRVTRLTDPAEVQARNARLADNPQAPSDRFDWIWSYDVASAMASA